MKPKTNPLEMNKLQEYTRSVIEETNASVIKEKLSWLLSFYDVINYKLCYEFGIWRAVKCDSPDGFENVKDLSFPPKESTKAGRLNEPKEPVFYAAFIIHTALEEVGAKEGDYVHVSFYKIDNNTGLRGCVVGEILRVHRSGRAMLSDKLGESLNRILTPMSKYEGRKYIFMDAFLASMLSNENASKNDYLHTRILGKLLMNSVKDIDAMVYPSITLEGAVNVAIKTKAVSSTLTLNGNSVIKINKRYDHGIFDFSIVKHSNKKNSDGTIVWG